MSASVGRVLHRICGMCDAEVTDERTSCPTCGSKLVEIRAETDELIGHVIDDRFEIRDKLGQGGMGSVYRAWQRSVGREVAVKLIDRTYSRDPMAVRRFLREARLASQLQQPNTVSVFDFGQASDGRLFIAMELCRGRTLHKIVLEEGVFTVERAVRVGVQICDALEAAHALGIIHRDLKLENVIVLDHPAGRDLVKVLDFGLAKNIQNAASGTESGVVLGTPRYMAPEAAMTGEALPAGDLYGLGVILGELVLGKPLWEGENLAHLVSQKLDPANIVAQVPAALRTIVGALLDAEPDRRPSAAQARALLQAALQDPGASDTVLDPPAMGRDTLQMRTPRKRIARLGTPSTEMELPSPRPDVSRPSLDELPRPRVSRRVLGVLGFAVLVTIGAIVLATRGGSGDPAHAGATAGSAPTGSAATIEPTGSDAPRTSQPVLEASLEPAPSDPAPPAAPPHRAPKKTVRVHVDTDPTGGVVTLDGKDHLAPFDAEVVPRAIYVVSARKDGFMTSQARVVANKDGDTSLIKLLPLGF